MGKYQVDRFKMKNNSEKALKQRCFIVDMNNQSNKKLRMFLFLWFLSSAKRQRPSVNHCLNYLGRNISKFKKKTFFRINKKKGQFTQYMAIDSEKNPISNQNERRGTTPMGERVATSLAV